MDVGIGVNQGKFLDITSAVDNILLLSSLPLVLLLLVLLLLVAVLVVLWSLLVVVIIIISSLLMSKGDGAGGGVISSNLIDDTNISRVIRVGHDIHIFILCVCIGKSLRKAVRESNAGSSYVVCTVLVGVERGGALGVFRSAVEGRTISQGGKKCPI